MALTHGQKILAAILGIGGTAGAALLIASEAQAAPPPSGVFVDIIIEPAVIPQEGGTVTISGETNLPAGSPVRITVNGKTVDDFTLTGESFSEKYDVSANTSSLPKTIVIMVAVGSIVKSSSVVIEGVVPSASSAKPLQVS